MNRCRRCKKGFTEEPFSASIEFVRDGMSIAITKEGNAKRVPNGTGIFATANICPQCAESLRKRPGKIHIDWQAQEK